MSGDNNDHSGVRLSQNGEMQQVTTATTRDYLHSRLEKCGLGIILLRSLCVCIVSVKINNEELFLMLSRLKVHIFLFLDRLRCGA